MERNWNLVRDILSGLETKQTTQEALQPTDLPEYDAEIVSYHIKLLDEACLIEGRCAGSLNAPLSCFAIRLTWEGHEFLDEIRSDTVWNKATEVLTDKGISLSFETIGMAVKSVVSNMLN